MRIEQQHQMTARGLQSVQCQLHKQGGVELAVRVDPPLAGLAARCDGTASLRDLLAEMARVLGPDAAASEAVLKSVQALVDRGILVPL